MTTEVGGAIRTPAPVQTSAPPARLSVTGETAPTGSDGSAGTLFAGAVPVQLAPPPRQASDTEPPPQQPPAEAQAVDREVLDNAVASVKEHIKVVERQLDFEVDEQTGRTLVRVVDPESGDLIRQLPPEAVVAAAAAIAELAANGTDISPLSGLLLQAEA